MTPSRGAHAVLVLAFATLVSLPIVRPASAATWRSLGPPGAAVTALARSETAPGRVYAGVVDGGVFRSDDGGASWSAATAGLPNGGGGPVLGWRLALDPAAPSTVYAASEDGVYRSDDQGQSWHPVHAAFSRARGAETALALPGGAVLVGLSDFVDGLWDGLLRSPDEGATWATVRDGFAALGLDELVPDPRNTGVLHALSFDGRVWRSPDAGADWSAAGGGLDGVVLYDLAIDPAQPDRLYASTQDSPSGVSLYRSLDGGASWQAAGAGLPCCYPRLAPDPARPAAAWALPLPATRLYRTTDGGAHWTPLGALPVGSTFVPGDLEVDPLDDSTLYLLGSEPGPPFCGASCAEDLLLRSGDGGATWTQLDLPASSNAALVRPDPVQPDVVYLEDGSTLYRSDDRGESWQALAEAPLLTDLRIDPLRPGVLYQATVQAGVLRSADGGLTWAPLGAGLPSPSVRRLALVSRGPDLLYAATDGGGWVLGLDPPQGGAGGSGAGTPPPVGPILTSPEFPGFRFQVRITSGGGEVQPVRQEASCLPETICVSGAVPGRSEIFLRIVGPKPNGRLWPTIVKFTTSQVEVWIEQTATNTSRYYRLAPARPGVDELPGLFDRGGFPP